GPAGALRGGVTETRQEDIESVGAVPIQEASDVLRARHRQNGDTLSVDIPTTAPSQRFQRDLVARAFDEHDGTRGHGLTHCVPLPCTRLASGQVTRGRRTRDGPCSISLIHPLARGVTVARLTLDQ